MGAKFLELMLHGCPDTTDIDAARAAEERFKCIPALIVEPRCDSTQDLKYTSVRNVADAETDRRLP